MGLMDTTRQLVEMTMETTHNGGLDQKNPLRTADMTNAWVAGVETRSGVNSATFLFFGRNPPDSTRVTWYLVPAFD